MTMKFANCGIAALAFAVAGCASFNDRMERISEAMANSRGELTPHQEEERQRRLDEQARVEAQQRAERDAADAAAARDRQARAEAQLAETRKPRPIPQQIDDQRQCIAQSDAAIARERAIEREVGVVDMATLHAAASQKIACQRQMAALQACQKKGGTCAADPYNQATVSP